MNKFKINILNCLLDFVIPENKKLKLPSAKDINLMLYLRKNNPETMIIVEQIIENLNDNSKLKYNKNINQISIKSKQNIFKIFLDSNETNKTEFLNNILLVYYTNENVIKHIIKKTVPPYPEGNTLDSGDFSLLKIVKNRGRIWKYI